ncbi:diaminopimelate epimerase [Clostridium rectalis]|uniref:diaminopimelate epimerase n=1 Tax=Clostridium rectalis TaxID=2040295 RepID=UPI0019D1B931|nr:diaminopimelate epimerase [Clostridium rectalis]
MNPVENMTVLITDQISKDMHMNIAKKIMNYNNIFAEQVGFIEKAISKKGKEKNCLRLQMMGGEFCGNATRALAAVLVYREYPYLDKFHNYYSISLEVSGADDLVECRVWNTESNNKFISQVKMPLPKRIENILIKYNNGNIEVLKVEFPGIIHIVVDSNKILNKDEFYNVIRDYFKDEEYEALGIMFYDKDKNYLEPLVYVKAIDSLFWERSCASGTCALGAALAFLRKSNISTEIMQPGGELEIMVNIENDIITSIEIKGLIEIVAEGSVYIT